MSGVCLPIDTSRCASPNWQNVAHKAGVKKLLLFHHDPDRSDAELELIEKKIQAAAGGKTSMEVMIAREGMTVEA